MTQSLTRKTVGPPVGRKIPDLSHKKFTTWFFVGKLQEYHCCRRRSGLPPGQTSRLRTNRVRRVNQRTRPG